MPNTIFDASLGTKLQATMRTARGAIWCALSDYKSIFAIVALYVTGVQSLSRSQPDFMGTGDVTSDTVAALLTDRLAPGLLLIALLIAIWSAIPKVGIIAPRHRAKFFSPLAAIIRDGGEPFFRLLIGLPLLAALIISFARIKAEIPAVSPFHWDTAFWQMDRTLHGGIDPWRITWSVFGSDVATLIIDRLYFSWFLVIHAVLFATILFDADARRRRQYLLTYVLIWTVLGTVCAILFSSAGPCYMANLENGNTAYLPLMAQLGDISERSLLTSQILQTQLWTTYTTDVGTHYGISAMPSLHVAHAVLLFLLARAHGKLLTYVALGYALIIMIGSVHLGWHYAVDGYFGAVATYGLWQLSGWWVSKMSRYSST